MAQTAEQIAKNINNRYVYYDTDGTLKIAQLGSGNSRVDVPNDSGKLTAVQAPQFKCTQDKFEGFDVQNCPELNPTKPAWVQLKDGDLGAALAKIKIKEDNVAEPYDIKYSAGSNLQASINDHTITLPKPDPYVGSLQAMQDDIKAYYIKADLSGLSIQKSSEAGYTQLKCDPGTGFIELDCGILTLEETNS